MVQPQPRAVCEASHRRCRGFQPPGTSFGRAPGLAHAPTPASRRLRDFPSLLPWLPAARCQSFGRAPGLAHGPTSASRRLRGLPSLLPWLPAARCQSFGRAPGLAHAPTPASRRLRGFPSLLPWLPAARYQLRPSTRTRPCSNPSLAPFVRLPVVVAVASSRPVPASDEHRDSSMLQPQPRAVCEASRRRCRGFRPPGNMPGALLHGSVSRSIRPEDDACPLGVAVFGENLVLRRALILSRCQRVGGFDVRCYIRST